MNGLESGPKYSCLHSYLGPVSLQRVAQPNKPQPMVGRCYENCPKSLRRGTDGVSGQKSIYVCVRYLPNVVFYV